MPPVRGKKLARFVELKSSFTEKLQARVRDGRIVARSTTAPDLVKCGLETQRSAVRPVRPHGFHDVGHANNARADEYLFSRNAIRVAATVMTLMMLEDHFRDGPGKLDAGDNIVAVARMAFDELAFCRTKLAGPRENFRGNAHLADVVDGGS